jgi:hypothetical protein
MGLWSIMSALFPLAGAGYLGRRHYTLAAARDKAGIGKS